MAASANNNNNNNNNKKEGAAGATSAEKNMVEAESKNNDTDNSNETTTTQSALKHNPGISVEWSPDEQSLLDDLLSKYASDMVVVRYAKIAMQLKDKTVRDVALRCRWMSKKENGKRRKEDHSGRKNKDRKEKASDLASKQSSHVTGRPNGPPYAPPMIPMDVDDGVSFKDIGGLTGELLEQNAQFLTQISSNFASYQVPDNINLLSKTRDNILTILNDLKDMPEIMKQMPPLPVKINQELANSILPLPSHPMKS